MVELIDTCWDVNILQLSYSMRQYHGINRYMLGCKLYGTYDNVIKYEN